MVEGGLLVELEAEGLNDALFGIPLVVAVEVVAADVGGLDESGEGFETLADVLVLVEQIEGVAAAGDLHVCGGAGGVAGGKDGGGAVGAALAGGAFDHLREDCPVLVGAPGEVGPADAVPTTAEFFVGVHQAYV